MKLQLAMFDWNGTLLDDLQIVYGSVVEIFSCFGLPAPTLEQYRNEITANFMNFYCSHGIPKSATAEQLNAIRKRYMEKHWQEPKLHPGVHELLAICKRLGLPVAIVSAEIAELLEKRLSDFMLLPYIDRVVGGAYNKPKALTETLDFFGVSAENAFYLDDTFDGLMAAKSVGITTIGFCNGYNSRKRIMYAEPDFPNSDFPKILTHADVRDIILRGGIQ